MSQYRIQNQIAVYKTKQKLVEFNDKLKPLRSNTTDISTLRVRRWMTAAGRAPVSA